jgi:hypothetical protein
VSAIHFIGGEKGGVGKSVCARVLCQYCIDRKVPFAGIDADSSHGALMRYYSEFSQAVDLEMFDSSDQIMDRALGAERQVIVDLPAQSARMLRRWLDSGDVVSFARDMGVRLFFWHVTDGGFDSVSEFARLLEHFDSGLEFVVVKNRGRSTDFSQLDESPVMETLILRGGRILELPALHGATMYKIDRKGSSFWAAIHSDSDELALLPMERQRTKLWLNQVFEAIDSAQVLGSEPD